MKFGCMELEMMVANLQKFCVEATKQLENQLRFCCILPVTGHYECCRFSYSGSWGLAVYQYVVWLHLLGCVQSRQGLFGYQQFGAGARLLSSLMVLDHGLVMVQFGCTHSIMNVGDRNIFVPLSKKKYHTPSIPFKVLLQYLCQSNLVCRKYQQYLNI